MNDSTVIDIWNRASDGMGVGQLGKGDRALGALLLAHGLIMNGGVFDAVTIMTQDDFTKTISRFKFSREAIGEYHFFDEALAGYGFFGLGAISELLVRAKDLLNTEEDIGSLEAFFDSEYQRILPNDISLFSIYEKCLVDTPHEFAALVKNY